MKRPLAARLIDLAIAIQQIPAPTFHEKERAEYICEQFQALGLSDAAIDAAGNACARLPGSGQARPLVLSAHCDTVFPPGADLSVSRQADRIFGPGLGDNSLGVAGLFGLVWLLRQRQIELPGDLWLAANVGEEGLGDLAGMRALVDRFGSSVLGYVVLEGMALGHVYHQGLGVRRYRISTCTPGGHSWVDFGRPSAVHELAKLINQILALPLPTQPRTTLNVGVVQGGTTVNTIAAEARLELDLRSEGAEALSNLAVQVEALAAGANRPGVEVRAEVIGARPSGQIAADHPFVVLALDSIRVQNLQASLGIGSTDANLPLSRGLPAICIGMTGGGGAHTKEEFILTAPIAQGLEHLAMVVQGAYQVLA